jgi:proline dehydrogenase
LGLREAIILRIAKRWIAGTRIEDAIKDAKKANSKGIDVVINYLGEDIMEERIAEKHAQEYINLQNKIKNEGIRGCVSLKLTQLGILIKIETAKKRLERIIENGENLNQYVWIDMEGSKLTDLTLSIYLEMLEKHSKIGVALQAYLKRTANDMEKIIERGGMVRLVKGAYKESKEIVFETRAEIRRNYQKLMERLFESGIYFAVATHDQKLIEKAIELSNIKKKGFEFEFLKGIRDDIKTHLAKEGYKVSEYLPYGENWYPYSKRRISEHPSNLILLLRSIV